MSSIEAGRSSAIVLSLSVLLVACGGGGGGGGAAGRAELNQLAADKAAVADLSDFAKAGQYVYGIFKFNRFSEERLLGFIRRHGFGSTPSEDVRECSGGGRTIVTTNRPNQTAIHENCRGEGEVSGGTERASENGRMDIVCDSYDNPTVRCRFGNVTLQNREFDYVRTGSDPSTTYWVADGEMSIQHTSLGGSRLTTDYSILLNDTLFNQRGYSFTSHGAVHDPVLNNDNDETYSIDGRISFSNYGFKDCPSGEATLTTLEAVAFPHPDSDDPYAGRIQVQNEFGETAIVEFTSNRSMIVTIGNESREFTSSVRDEFCNVSNLTPQN